MTPMAPPPGRAARNTITSNGCARTAASNTLDIPLSSVNGLLSKNDVVRIIGPNGPVDVSAATLSGPVRAVFESAFGQSFGELFLVAAPFAVVALVCMLFIREVPLRTTNDLPGHDELLADAAPEATAELTATIPSR